MLKLRCVDPCAQPQVFVVPTVWLSSGSLVMPPADYLNVTCPAVTPSTTPYTSIAMTASRQAFVDAWKVRPSKPRNAALTHIRTTSPISHRAQG